MRGRTKFLSHSRLVRSYVSLCLSLSRFSVFSRYVTVRKRNPRRSIRDVFYVRAIQRNCGSLSRVTKWSVSARKMIRPH